MPGFTADDLLDCYRRGVFPMADARHDERLFLVDPAKRGVIPLDSFHVSRRLARTLRSGRFETRMDCAFEAKLLGKVWMMLFLIVTSSSPVTGASRIFPISPSTSSVA